jgi:hypothetical protein
MNTITTGESKKCASMAYSQRSTLPTRGRLSQPGYAVPEALPQAWNLPAGALTGQSDKAVLTLQQDNRARKKTFIR